MEPILQLSIIFVLGALGFTIILNEVPRSMVKSRQKKAKKK
jgi:hypothetical protein